jgi:dihydroorotase
MSLYLHPSITPATIKAAKAAGITGVKSYPAGVTTNSASGVVDYESFYPVFTAMEEEDMVLNLHGESPPGEDITVLNAEQKFLPTLLDLHRRFPTLRIILEHCTTVAAIEAVKSCGASVAATITPHHMFLIIDDVVGDPMNFCKPISKCESDRLALIRAAVSGSSKFFLGTDSAPHPLHAKRGGVGDVLGKCAAGIWTQPYATQLVLEALEQAIEKAHLDKNGVTEKMLTRFLSENGREFYRQEMSKERRIKITAAEERVIKQLHFGPDQNVIVPFRRGEPIYSLEWI